jgi:hypothetical protein
VPYIGSKDASNFITVAASQWFKNASNLWVPVSATNPLPNTLAGSSIPDSQAVPMTQSQKDIVARAVDAVVDTIGAENIKLFLPMWETSGTKAYDLLRRDLTFSYVGPTLGQSGVFGSCPLFDGSNDYVIQDPVTEASAGASDYNLTSGTGKAATRMAAIATNPGFVRLKLKRTGTLSSATVRVVIYSESGAFVPDAAVSNGASDSLACSIIDTTYGFYGFAFPTPSDSQKDRKYFIVLEYVNATGVDASNYISWQYETGANTYGEKRATYDGSAWTGVVSENHVFGLWSNDLAFGDDYSIIALAKNTSTNPLITKPVIRLTGGSAAVAGLNIGAYTYCFGNDGTSRLAEYYHWSTSFDAYGMTFTKAASTAKIKGYHNGAYVANENGTGATANLASAHPVSIGGKMETNGAFTTYWQGLIGPVIIAKNALSDANMAKVSHNLLALRKYGMTA